MTKDADGKIVFDTEINTKTFDEQIGYLEEKINDLIADYNDMASQKGFNEQSNHAIQLRNQIEQVANQIIGLRKQQTKLEETSNKGWKKMANSLKKVALRMVGIASVYGIISRASSTYLNENEEVANKLKNIWSVLGDVLGPVINGVADLILKGVGYLNEFIKALTGVDKIAEHNAKALQKQAKAQKQLNIETYDFDVIRKQSGALKNNDVEGLINIPQLDQGIINKLKRLAEVLKENKDLVKAVGEALAITFGVVAIAKILSNIGTLMGSGTLLTGLNGLATILAIIGTVWVATIAVKGLAEALKQAKELKQIREELEGKIEKQSNRYINEAQEAYQGYLEGKYSDEKIINTLKALISISEETIRQTKSFGTGKEIDKAIASYEKEIEEYNKLLNKVYQNMGISNSIIGNVLSQPGMGPLSSSDYADIINNSTSPLPTISENKPNTINVYIDGRLVQKQVSTVQNNLNFATNK